MNTQNTLCFGVAGWSYPDWEGTVYPKRRSSDFHPLGYLAQYVDAVEINSSFYHPLSERNVKNWLRIVRSRENFTFTVKLWQRFTHERPAITKENVLTFRRGLDAFLVSDKLSALLIQFPWSFKNTEPNRRYLCDLLDVFGDAHPAVEMRHASWDEEDFFNLLRGKRAAFVNVDQPQVSNSLGPTEVQTSDLSYVRLHGQNTENWFKEGAGRDGRYDYLYSRKELAPWALKIQSLSASSKRTVVIANNHYRGSAFYNILELKSMVTKKKVSVPPQAQEHLSRLRDIAANPILDVQFAKQVKS